LNAATAYSLEIKNIVNQQKKEAYEKFKSLFIDFDVKFNLCSKELF
jgi:hypothetical protein